MHKMINNSAADYKLRNVYYTNTIQLRCKTFTLLRGKFIQFTTRHYIKLYQKGLIITEDVTNDILAHSLLWRGARLRLSSVYSVVLLRLMYKLPYVNTNLENPGLQSSQLLLGIPASLVHQSSQEIQQDQWHLSLLALQILEILENQWLQSLRVVRSIPAGLPLLDHHERPVIP